MQELFARGRQATEGSRERPPSPRVLSYLLGVRFLTYLAPNALPLYEHVADQVGRALGVETRMDIGRDPSQMELGEADFAFLCSRPYIWIRDRGIALEPVAAPVLTGERHAGRPMQYSDVIVRADSAHRTFEDLRGTRCAYNGSDSHSGYGILLLRLAAVDGPRPFFSSTLEAGFHQAAIRAVVSGEADTAAVDSQVLAIEMDNHPELAASLRVIESLGPSTTQPLVAAAHISAGVLQEVRAVITGLPPSAPMAAAHVERFVAVADGDYDTIRAMMRIARSAGITGLE